MWSFNTAAKRCLRFLLGDGVDGAGASSDGFGVAHASVLESGGQDKAGVRRWAKVWQTLRAGVG